MGLLELLLLLIILALVIVLFVIVYVRLIWCSGKKYVGPTQNPEDGVVNVKITRIDCDSFTVGFDTTQPKTEVSGTMDLSPWSEPNGVQISFGPHIHQTVRATYSTPQTVHHIRFSNGSFGLLRGQIYRFGVGGRDRADDGSFFHCKTAQCCVGEVLERGMEVIQETVEWSRKPPE